MQNCPQKRSERDLVAIVPRTHMSHLHTIMTNARWMRPSERERVKGNLRGSIPSPFLSIYHMVVVITAIELIRILSRRCLDLMCGARLWISIDTAEWHRRRYSHVEPFKFPDFFPGFLPELASLIAVAEQSVCGAVIKYSIAIEPQTQYLTYIYM